MSERTPRLFNAEKFRLWRRRVERELGYPIPDEFRIRAHGYYTEGFSTSEFARTLIEPKETP